MANLNPIVQTTLSVSLPNTYPDRVDPQGTVVTLASDTDVLAPGPNKSNRTMLLIDREILEVIALTSSGQPICHRGLYGTEKLAHSAGTPVWVGPESAFAAWYQDETFKSNGTYARQCVQFEAVNPVSLTNTVALTAVQMRGGLINGAPTGAANYTTDTATNIINDLASFSVGAFWQTPGFIGLSYKFTIVNTAAGAYTITLVAGAGVTLVGGTVTIAQNAARQFRVVITDVVTPAVTIYQVS